jgi:hypothetical protein
VTSTQRPSTTENGNRTSAERSSLKNQFEPRSNDAVRKNSRGSVDTITSTMTAQSNGSNTSNVSSGVSAKRAGSNLSTYPLVLCSM